jgi:hypothetical protein
MIPSHRVPCVDCSPREERARTSPSTPRRLALGTAAASTMAWERRARHGGTLSESRKPSAATGAPGGDREGSGAARRASRHSSATSEAPRAKSWRAGAVSHCGKWTRILRCTESLPATLPHGNRPYGRHWSSDADPFGLSWRSTARPPGHGPAAVEGLDPRSGSALRRRREGMWSCRTLRALRPFARPPLGRLRACRRTSTHAKRP